MLELPWWSDSQNSVLLLKGALVWSLIQELRFHIPYAMYHGKKKKKNKKKNSDAHGFGTEFPNQWKWSSLLEYCACFYQTHKRLDCNYVNIWIHCKWLNIIKLNTWSGRFNFLLNLLRRPKQLAEDSVISMRNITYFILHFSDPAFVRLQVIEEPGKSCFPEIVLRLSSPWYLLLLVIAGYMLNNVHFLAEHVFFFLCLTVTTKLLITALLPSFNATYFLISAMGSSIYRQNSQSNFSCYFPWSLG